MSAYKYTYIVCDECNHQDPGGIVGDKAKDARKKMHKAFPEMIFKHGKDFCDKECLRKYESNILGLNSN